MVIKDLKNLNFLGYRIKLEYNDDMNLLDFKFNENGFVFIQKSTDSQEKLRDHRKLLVKLHNVRQWKNSLISFLFFFI